MRTTEAAGKASSAALRAGGSTAASASERGAQRRRAPGNTAGAPVRWLTPEEYSAWRGLLRMQAQLGAKLNHELSSSSGLSLQDYGVLVVLSEQPGGRLRSFELARELGWEKSRVSHHVGRMEKRGLVSRQPCPSDRRGLNIAITPEGRRALEAAAPAHVEQVRRAFIDLLTPDQIASLSDITRTVVDALAQECDSVLDP